MLLHQTFVGKDDEDVAQARKIEDTLSKAQGQGQAAVFQFVGEIADRPNSYMIPTLVDVRRPGQKR